MGDEARSNNGKFEPPPWELEAFEALAHKRAEEQAALDALAGTAPAPGTPPIEAVSEVAGGGEPVTGGPESGPAAVVAADAPKGTEPVSEQTEAQKIDERRVQAMLLELGREETANTGNIKLIAHIASIVTAVVGFGMLFGGLMAIRGAGGTSAGVMGSGALSVFGLCFVAMAVWVWVGSNRTKRSR